MPSLQIFSRAKPFPPFIPVPSGSFIGRERQSSRTATLPLPDKTVGVFCLYDENDLNATSSKTEGTEAIQVEQADIAIENGPGKDRTVDLRKKTAVELRVTDIEKAQDSNEFSFSNPAFQTDGTLDIVCEQTLDNLGEELEPRSSGAVLTEQTKKDNEFSFSNPGFRSEDKQVAEGAVPRERSQNDELMEDRQSNRSGSSEGYASSPETDSVDSIDCVCAYTDNKTPTEKSEYRKKEICAADQTRPGSVTKDQTRPDLVTKGSDTSFCGVSVIIEEVTEQEMKNSKTINAWTDWFKTPLFYKVFRRSRNLFLLLRI